jgi:hypothetical protein
LDSKDLLGLAAKAGMRVLEDDTFWIVERGEIPDVLFKKHDFNRSIAEVYCDGMALRITASQMAQEEAIDVPKLAEAAHRGATVEEMKARIFRLELVIQECRTILNSVEHK